MSENVFEGSDVERTTRKVEVLSDKDPRASEILSKYENSTRVSSSENWKASSNPDVPLRLDRINTCQGLVASVRKEGTTFLDQSAPSMVEASHARGVRTLIEPEELLNNLPRGENYRYKLVLVGGLLTSSSSQQSQEGWRQTQEKVDDFIHQVGVDKVEMLLIETNKNPDSSYTVIADPGESQIFVINHE